jgi:hypothetical protein
VEDEFTNNNCKTGISHLVGVESVDDQGHQLGDLSLESKSFPRLFGHFVVIDSQVLALTVKVDLFLFVLAKIATNLLNCGCGECSVRALPIFVALNQMRRISLEWPFYTEEGK